MCRINLVINFIRRVRRYDGHTYSKSVSNIQHVEHGVVPIVGIYGIRFTLSNDVQ